MEPIVLDPAGTHRGRLQRGRGCAARRAAGTPGAGDLIYECVTRDPRWDTLEARGLYYARLMADLGLGTGPITAHLLGPDDRADPDEDRTNLAIDVLAHLVRLGRDDALAALRRYTAEGWNRAAALAALAELGAPACAAARPETGWRGGRGGARPFGAPGSSGSAAPEPGPYGPYGAGPYDSGSHGPGSHGPGSREAGPYGPGASAGRGPAPCRLPAAGRPAAPRRSLGRRSDADLADLARLRGDGTTAAILELGRRRSPLVLDLVEDLMPRGDYDGPLCRAVRDLGAGALPRARRWAAGQRSYHDVGIDVLAAHGTGSDVPLLMAALEVALDEEDWDLAAVPADGLGRLRVRRAIPPLLYGWEESASSHLRVNILGALARIDPHIAEPYLVEGLWDCEDGARRIAAEGVPLSAETRARLRRLRREPAEDGGVRSAAATRLPGEPG